MWEWEAQICSPFDPQAYLHSCWYRAEVAFWFNLLKDGLEIICERFYNGSFPMVFPILAAVEQAAWSLRSPLCQKIYSW